MNQPVLTASIETSRLTQLIVTVEDEHRHVVKAIGEALQHAVLCGEALIEARDLIPPGDWMVWSDANFTIVRWTRNVYIRLAEYREYLMLPDAPVTVTGALTYLRELGIPKGTTKPGRLYRAKPSFDVEEAKRLRLQGLSYSAIARLFGVNSGTVQRHLNPVTKRKAYEATHRRAKEQTAARRALAAQRRSEEIKRIGGAAAQVYATLRRCQLVVDRCISDSDDRDYVTAMRSVQTSLVRAESEIVRALRVDK